MTQILSDTSAERALIGSMLIDPLCIHAVRAVVEPSAFTDANNRAVYDAICALTDEHAQIDVLTISARLHDSKRLKSVGGPAAIAGLINETPTSVHALEYAQRIQELARRRGMIAVAADLVRKAHDMSADTDGVAAWAMERMRDHMVGGELQSAAAIANDIADEMAAYTKEPLKPGQVRGLSTGWRDLDGALGGWRPGFYVVLGEPHVGKSWFLLWAAARVAESGRRVLLFSLEMGASSLVRRLCLARARVSRRDYDLGHMTREQVEAFTDMAARISEWNMDIADTIDTVAGITATIYREAMSDEPPALIVVDYLGLIRTSYHAESANWEIINLTRALKALSHQLQIPLLTAHQISDKAIEQRRDKRPRKADAYASGGISQDADVLLGLYRSDLHPEAHDARDPVQPNVMEVIVFKDRLAGTQPGLRIPLYFAPTGALADLAR